ncbi:formyltransferase family protein [bacterium]|nr:formyltransferase family protein [bacterium]
MIIAIFGYDFHHYKTNTIIKDTFINGFSIGAVLLAPKIDYISNGNIGSIDNDSKNDEIREFCKANNINFYRIKHNDNSKIKMIVDSNNIDVGLIGGAKIIHQSVIKLFKSGIINYHPGRIPETSGLDSLYRTIENFVPPCVTAHLIDQKIDAGLLINEAIVEVFKDDTLESISSRILKKQIEINQFVLRDVKDKKLNFPKINRPKKNKKLSVEEKEKIITFFEKWKNKFSANL